MTDSPILFSGPMVHAILDGRKTQTRRVLKSQPELLPNGKYHVSGNGGGCAGVAEEDIASCAVDYLRIAVGDRLWVREACHAEELSRPQITRKATPRERAMLKRTEVVVCDELDGADGVRYLADDDWKIIENSFEASERWIDLFRYRGGRDGRVGRTVAPNHMPRWASRITLLVTDVRVQRLQDISEEDAIAEGCRPFFDETDPEIVHGPNGTPHEMIPLKGPTDHFRNLWNNINGPGSWEANPWVAAYTFTPVFQNIDQIKEAA